MSNREEELLVVRGHSSQGETWLSFREPKQTQVAVLCGRLAEDRYDKPFLVDNRKTRSLCFGIDGAVQSEMRFEDPEALVSAYTRKMMGFLLFRRRPRKVLMLGLGGGSLVKFCHRHLPTARMTVIEIDNGVIALRPHFQIPPDDSRLQVINGDGSAYVTAMALSNQRTDVLLVDAFDRQGIAPAVTETGFLQDARSVLSKNGIFVMNLVDSVEACRRHIEKIRSVFGAPVVAVNVDNGANVVVFAGRPLLNRQNLVAVPHHAQLIEKRLGLRFPTLVQLTRELQCQLRFRSRAPARSPCVSI
jgi:spermidine synthase